MLGGIEILYIILCIIFIFLVLMQNTSGNGLSNITGGDTSSSKSKRITGLTKITAALGLIIFALTFYIAYDNKNVEENFLIKSSEVKGVNNNE